jgi:two-component system phosphate regulon sensor histidine kinase PhoR
LLQNWRKELHRVLFVLAAAIVLGLVFDQLLLFLLVTLTAYFANAIYQVRRLYLWLSHLAEESNTPPPESKGFWGDIFDGIYRLQQRERRASEYLQSILDKAQESSAALEMAVILIDKQGNLDWWNKAGGDLLGLRYPQDKHQPATNLIRDPRFSDYFYKEKFSEPLTINSPRDNNIVLEFQITLFGEREKLIVVRDITQIHRLELMRKDFVANVSHELRTPITVISGYLETLLENIDSIEPRWRKPLQQMQQQSRRMENIVRDLLMLSRLETKAITRQQTAIDVRQLLLEVRSDSLQLFADKGHDISVACEQGMLLRADRSELYSAVSNLVFNAAKYTPAGGRIVIEVAVDSNALRISVSDNGIGIEEHHIPRLTERFYRVDVSRASSTGGTGLGLAIVKHVLVRHGATLDIASQPGKGSCFTCIFPINRVTWAKDLQQVAGGG